MRKLDDYVRRTGSGAISATLALTAYKQVDRPDALVWVPLFAVPACLGFFHVLRPSSIDTVFSRGVISVHLACSWCLLIFEIISLVRVVAYNRGAFLFFEESGESDSLSLNPLNYREGWECGVIAVQIAWIKWFRKSVRQHLRDSGKSAEPASPRQMIKTLLFLLTVPFVLSLFCYVEGLSTALGSLVVKVAHTTSMSGDSSSQRPQVHPW